MSEREIVSVSSGSYRLLDRLTKLGGVAIVAIGLEVGGSTLIGIALGVVGATLALTTVFINEEQ